MGVTLASASGKTRPEGPADWTGNINPTPWKSLAASWKSTDTVAVQWESYQLVDNDIVPRRLTRSRCDNLGDALCQLKKFFRYKASKTPNFQSSDYFAYLWRTDLRIGDTDLTKITLDVLTEHLATEKY